MATSGSAAAPLASAREASTGEGVIAPPMRRPPRSTQVRVSAVPRVTAIAPRPVGAPYSVKASHAARRRSMPIRAGGVSASSSGTSAALTNSMGRSALFAAARSASVPAGTTLATRRVAAPPARCASARIAAISSAATPPQATASRGSVGAGRRTTAPSSRAAFAALFPRSTA